MKIIENFKKILKIKKRNEYIFKKQNFYLFLTELF